MFPTLYVHTRTVIIRLVLVFSAFYVRMRIRVWLSSLKPASLSLSLPKLFCLSRNQAVLSLEIFSNLHVEDKNNKYHNDQNTTAIFWMT